MSQIGYIPTSGSANLSAPIIKCPFCQRQEFTLQAMKYHLWNECVEAQQTFAYK